MRLRALTPPPLLRRPPAPARSRLERLCSSIDTASVDYSSLILLIFFLLALLSASFPLLLLFFCFFLFLLQLHICLLFLLILTPFLFLQLLFNFPPLPSSLSVLLFPPPSIHLDLPFPHFPPRHLLHPHRQAKDATVPVPTAVPPPLPLPYSPPTLQSHTLHHSCVAFYLLQ